MEMSSFSAAVFPLLLGRAICRWTCMLILDCSTVARSGLLLQPPLSLKMLNACSSGSWHTVRPQTALAPLWSRNFINPIKLSTVTWIPETGWSLNIIFLCFLSAKLLYGFLCFVLFVTVIVAKLKLKSANLKIKWPPALYDFDKSRPLGRALHFKNNEPGLIKNCLLNRAEKRRLWTGF